MLTKTVRKHPNPDPYVTDNPHTIVRFSSNRWLVVSQKPEGKPVCLRYSSGKLAEAFALEPGGMEGADVTDALRGISNIPAHIGYNGDLEIYGTVVLPWKQYKMLRGEEYISSFPDKLAKEVIDGVAYIDSARLELIVWHCGNIPGLYTKQGIYKQLADWGFRTANYRLLVPMATARQIKGIQRVMNTFVCEYPVGSLLFENNEQSRDLRYISLGWGYDLSVVYRLCAEGRLLSKTANFEEKISHAC